MLKRLMSEEVRHAADSPSSSVCSWQGFPDGFEQSVSPGYQQEGKAFHVLSLWGSGACYMFGASPLRV